VIIRSSLEKYLMCQQERQLLLVSSGECWRTQFIEVQWKL